MRHARQRGADARAIAVVCGAPAALPTIRLRCPVRWFSDSQCFLVTSHCRSARAPLTPIHCTQHVVAAPPSTARASRERMAAARLLRLRPGREMECRQRGPVTRIGARLPDPIGSPSSDNRPLQRRSRDRQPALRTGRRRAHRVPELYSAIKAQRNQSNMRAIMAARQFSSDQDAVARSCQRSQSNDAALPSFASGRT